MNICYICCLFIHICKKNDQELKSLAGMFDLNLKIPIDYNIQEPFMVLEFPATQCPTVLMERTVLVKSLYEFWADGKSLEEVCGKLRLLPATMKEKYTDPKKTFKIQIEAFNKRFTMAEKVKKIEHILEHGVDFGAVNLNDPDHCFGLMEYYEDSSSSQPTHVLFGRWLQNGQKEMVNKYDLKKREFIGNTSMDAHLSLIMANQARVQGSHLVTDPFVGTGSLLVAAAHFGAYVSGTDIDLNLIYGKGKSSKHKQKWRCKNESIENNLKHYGLGDKYLDILLADSSRAGLLRSGPLFDAILTDPPYGIRESTRRVATTKADDCDQKQERQGCVSTEQYHISQVYRDLLNFAARFLVPGGRLVYWLPVFTAEYCEEHVPCHPCLDLEENCEQVLSSRTSRRLITMQKTLISQNEEVLNGAYIKSDAYADATFRDKYFMVDGSDQPQSSLSQEHNGESAQS